MLLGNVFRDGYSSHHQSNEFSRENLKSHKVLRKAFGLTKEELTGEGRNARNMEILMSMGKAVSPKCGHQQAYCSFPTRYVRMEHLWNDNDRGNRRTRRKNCPSSTLTL
jgi:hypothetical protein